MISDQAEKPEGLAAIGPIPPQQPGKPKVLAVDDEKNIRDMLRSALEEIGFCDVETAANGREALNALRSQPFDLVITDLMMPEMNGTRLLEISRNEFPEIPMIVITGYAQMETVIEVLRLGAANFITKPFRLQEIRAVIEKALKRKRDREIPRLVLPCLVREVISFRIPPLLETKTGVIHYLTEKIVGAGICDESGRYFISVSLDEALTNAIFYGCLEIPSGLRETEPGNEVFNRIVQERMADERYNKRAIEVEMELDRDRVLYRVTDPGPGFDPPDLSKGPPEPSGISQLHGRGLLLISCFMDEVSFNEKGNRITLVKKRRSDKTE